MKHFSVGEEGSRVSPNPAHQNHLGIKIYAFGFGAS